MQAYFIISLIVFAFSFIAINAQEESIKLIRSFDPKDNATVVRAAVKDSTQLRKESDAQLIQKLGLDNFNKWIVDVKLIEVYPELPETIVHQGNHCEGCPIGFPTVEKVYNLLSYHLQYKFKIEGIGYFRIDMGKEKNDIDFLPSTWNIIDSSFIQNIKCPNHYRSIKFYNKTPYLQCSNSLLNLTTREVFNPEILINTYKDSTDTFLKRQIGVSNFEQWFRNEKVVTISEIIKDKHSYSFLYRYTFYIPNYGKAYCSLMYNLEGKIVDGFNHNSFPNCLKDDNSCSLISKKQALKAAETHIGYNTSEENCSFVFNEDGFVWILKYPNKNLVIDASTGLIK